MTGSQRILLLIAAVFAVAYVATLSLQPFAGDFVVKSVPAVCMAALALRAIPGLRGTTGRPAIVCSAPQESTRGDKFLACAAVMIP